jgi:hypothetical protein
MRIILIRIACLAFVFNATHALANSTTNNERAKEIKSSLIQNNNQSINSNVLNNYSQPKVVKYLVNNDISIEDIEEAMESAAIGEGIRSVGMLPLSEMVELQTGEKQRFLKIYQYVSPRDSIVLANYNPEFSALLPIRISLAEDKNGKMWLYSIDIDSIFRSDKVINPTVDRLLLELKRVINAIMIAGKAGDF